VPAGLELTVRPGTDVLPETGASATAMPPAGIMITIDANRDGGVEGTVKRWLRPIIFHELHHLARARVVSKHSLAERVISEGMASVFERDFAKSEAPWSAYGDDIIQWADQILALPDDAPPNDWIYKHPDGRLWVGMKVGSYWVDRAAARSGRLSTDLIAMSAVDIIALARNEPP
jgi:uncharacterized protein YjaZ